MQRKTTRYRKAFLAAIAAAAALAAAWAAPERCDAQFNCNCGFVDTTACDFCRERLDQTLTCAKGEFERLVAGPGNVGLSITNYGAVGNDFDDRTASFEFPNGSEIEHLIRGGIWVGAITSAGVKHVSIGSTSQNISSTGSAATEFKPLARFEERSTLRNSAVYDPEAISEQDLFASFRDFPAPKVSSGENPCPLGIEVGLTCLGWSFKPVDEDRKSVV